MCLLRKEMFLSLADLRYLSLQCPNDRCKTQIILDLTSQAQPHTGRSESNTPEKCPSCDTGFDQTLQASIDKLRKSYACLLPFDKQVAFRTAHVPSE